MNKLVFLFLILLPGLSFASLPVPASSAEELMDKVSFHYSSSDGEFQLECKHWIGNTAGDFDVICGKGTRHVKQYLVHLVIRPMKKTNETTFEILYWVTDRNTKTAMPAFSSVSQLLTVDSKSQLKKIRMSQGIENDYAQMELTYLP